MLFAFDLNGQTVEPTFSGERAFCPLCGSAVVAKCGYIIGNHWSHLSGRDCDPWAEKLTEWHLSWQKLLKTKRNAELEVTITKNGISHRADAVLPDGKIIELQHSSISPSEIRQREEFYGENMIWVFDIRDACKNGRFNRIFLTERRGFKWKHPRKSISFAERAVFLDLGNGDLFEIEEMFPGKSLKGIGKIHHSDIIEDHT